MAAGGAAEGDDCVCVSNMARANWIGDLNWSSRAKRGRRCLLIAAGANRLEEERRRFPRRPTTRNRGPRALLGVHGARWWFFFSLRLCAARAFISFILLLPFSFFFFLFFFSNNIRRDYIGEHMKKKKKALGIFSSLIFFRFCLGRRARARAPSHFICLLIAPFTRTDERRSRLLRVISSALTCTRSIFLSFLPRLPRAFPPTVERRRHHCRPL